MITCAQKTKVCHQAEERGEGMEGGGQGRRRVGKEGGKRGEGKERSGVKGKEGRGTLKVQQQQRKEERE